MHNHHDTKGHFPSGTVVVTHLPPEHRLSFYALLLPYVEQDAAFKQLRFNECWDSDANRRAVSYQLWREFHCPDWVRERSHTGHRVPQRGLAAHTNYVGMAGLGADAALRPARSPGIGIFGYDRTTDFKQITDGTASTIMLIETGHEVGPWMRGGCSTIRGLDLNLGHQTGDGLPFGGTHFLDSTVLRKQQPNGFHVLLADGSTRYVLDLVNPSVLASLATIAGKDELPGDW